MGRAVANAAVGVHYRSFKGSSCKTIYDKMFWDSSQTRANIECSSVSFHIAIFTAYVPKLKGVDRSVISIFNI